MTEATRQAIALADASDAAELGGKAVQLGAAIRAGLPVPEGIALAATLVEAVAGDDAAAERELRGAPAALRAPRVVRSSGIGEDGLQASFAGQHQTVVNVGPDELAEAVRVVHGSAAAESALAYRRRLGLDDEPRTGVVVQRMLDPEVAGVMFTTNPLSGADERVIESAWGLGEAVVAGRVIPDRFRVARSGEVLERTAGEKLVAIRPAAGGGTCEVALEAALARGLSLDDAELAGLHLLAERCEAAFGAARDIEWALAGGELHLLQCRAVTR